MEKRFDITVNEEADQHLEVNIQHLEDGSLKLTQSKLLSAVFTEFDYAFKSIKLRHSVPMNPNLKRKVHLHLLGSIIFFEVAPTSLRLYHSSLRSVLNLRKVIVILSSITKDIGLVIRPGSRDDMLRRKCYESPPSRLGC